LIKDETKITLKTAIKAKNFNKKFERFLLGKNENETNVFQLCCGQRVYVGYVGWKNLENYVEMVAGLPSNKQKMKIFCKSNKRSYGVYKHIKTFKMQCFNFPTD
jgi:hypothetical protein